MASSLAARIQAEFGITSELIGGHGGIYELSINGAIVYTNQSSCGQFPADEVIFNEIRKLHDPISAEDKVEREGAGEITAPSCSLPALSPCGCLPIIPEAEASAHSECCPPLAETPSDGGDLPLTGAPITNRKRSCC